MEPPHEIRDLAWYAKECRRIVANALREHGPGLGGKSVHELCCEALPDVPRDIIAKALTIAAIKWNGEHHT